MRFFKTNETVSVATQKLENHFRACGSVILTYYFRYKTHIFFKKLLKPEYKADDEYLYLSDEYLQMFHLGTSD